MAPDVSGNQIKRKSELYLSRFHQTPRNLKKESERLKTFINWPVSFLDPKKLAKNGFYFTNTEDIAKCAFCNVQIGCWVDGDVPEEEHKTHSPNCFLIKGLECGNLSLTDGGDENEENKPEESPSQDVCGSLGLEIRPFSAPERPGKNNSDLELWMDFEELGISKISGPVSPNFATLNARLKTFKDWPVPEIQSPEKLAEAGFYYTYFQDNVLCFHCGGGLKNWEVGDDPWVDHARWFSRCGYVILRKGREFVNEVLAKSLSYTGVPTEKVKKCERKEEEKEEKKVSEIRKEAASTSSAPSVSSTSNPDKESQLPQSSNPDDKEFELCRICYARERGIVFLPCGHFVSCTQCAPSLSSCAVCRKPFEATVRAYLS